MAESARNRVLVPFDFVRLRPSTAQTTRISPTFKQQRNISRNYWIYSSRVLLKDKDHVGPLIDVIELGCAPGEKSAMKDCLCILSVKHKSALVVAEAET